MGFETVGQTTLDRLADPLWSECMREPLGCLLGRLRAREGPIVHSRASSYTGVGWG